jgi:hypothetical protein
MTEIWNCGRDHRVYLDNKIARYEKQQRVIVAIIWFRDKMKLYNLL